jgi:threonine dehydrogenase-like Zn-dependent dehydrogenase
MKACVFHGPGDVRVEERPQPRPGPGEMLLKMRATGICYSDIRVYKGEKKARPGVIPGHEPVGVIAALGEGVEGFRAGQEVALCPILACGACFFCRRGYRNRCPQRTTLGYEADGGLAEYMLVPAALLRLGHVFPLPPGLPAARATLTEPLACVLNSLETCRLTPGGSLVVVGAGPMGLLHIMLARQMGVATIIAAELVDERLAHAHRWGADLCLSPERDDLAARVLDATDGLGADAVVVSTGSAQAVVAGLALARRQGVVSLFGGFPPDATIPLDVNAIHYGELVLTGSQNATSDQYRRALLLLTRLPQAEEINTHPFEISDSPKAYSSRLGMDGLKSLVVF